MSDSILATDCRDKVPLYAEASIPEVWLVNLDEGMIEVYSDAGERVYRETRRALSREKLALPGELQSNVSVDEVLGNA